MATLLGTDTYQKQTSSNIVARPAGQLVTGEVMYYRGTYTTTGAEVTADIIPVAKLPIGAIVIPSLCWVAAEACGGTTVAIDSLGDAGSATRYSSTDIGVTTAVVSAVTATNAQMVTPWAIDTEANRTILAAMTHAGAPTAAKKITFLIAFRMP